MSTRARVISIGLTAASLALLAACGPTANQGTVSDGTGAADAGGQPAANDAPTWGKRYTWDDGMAVEVSAPAACKPGEYAIPQNIQRAVKFTITIINGTKDPFEVALLTVTSDAQFDGKKAEHVLDSDGACGGGGLESGTVMPGKTFSYDVAFAVGANPGEMQLAFQPGLRTDRAVYTGQV